VSSVPGSDHEGRECHAGLYRSRRVLFDAAIGGVALVAGGLLLPDRLVKEAAAVDHPVRRIQDRRERQRPRRRRRTHGDDKGNNGGKDQNGKFQPPNGGVQWQTIVPHPAFDVELWAPQSNIWSITESRQVPADRGYASPIIWPEAVLWINHRYFLSARQVDRRMYVALGYGGAIGIDGSYWHGGTEVVPLRELRLEDYFNVKMTVDNITFTVSRTTVDYRWVALSIE
jgi:hypothetical protein